MAQSAPKERALLGIEPFWERPTLEPLLRWERWRIILKLAILARERILIHILREAPPDKNTFHPNISMMKIWTIALLKANKTAEFGTNSLRMHGSTNVRRLKRREYCVVTDHGNFATPKLSRSLTLALAWKAVGYLVLKNQPFKLIKSRQRIFGRVWITSSQSREI